MVWIIPWTKSKIVTNLVRNKTKLEDFQDVIYSYEIISDLFDIFNQEKNALSFSQWFTKISKLENIIEIQKSWRMIQNHLTRILNYFNNWFSNAFAE